MSEVEKFKLIVTMSATVTVFNEAGEPKDWLRQGSETHATWNGMPDQPELMLRYQDMTTITSATLGDILGTSTQALKDRDQGR